MSSGTTTIKMISSTSTTSTSGVIFISDCRPESESSLLNCMTGISSTLCPGFFSDQSYPAEACLIECEHGLPDLAELELRIASDHNPWVLLVANSIAEGFAEMISCDPLIVDPQL